jgi:hypothetical protein
MIRIAISQAEFDAIAATMLFGNVNNEAKTNAKARRRWMSASLTGLVPCAARARATAT